MPSVLRLIFILSLFLSGVHGADANDDAPAVLRPEREAMVLDAFFTFNRILEEDILNGSHRHRSFLHRHFEGDKGGLTKRTGFLLAPVADRPVDPLQLEAEHQAFLRDPDNGWDIIARDDGTSFEIFRAANPLQPRVFRAEMVVDKGKLFVKRFAPE